MLHVPPCLFDLCSFSVQIVIYIVLLGLISSIHASPSTVTACLPVPACLYYVYHMYKMFRAAHGAVQGRH